MIQRAAPPPTGPRLDGTRGGSRGGIQKRKGPTAPARIDRDGDLVMNAAATDKVKSGRGQIEATRSSRSHAASRGGVPMGPRGGNASKQAAIIRGIATRNANIVSSRPVNGQLGSLRVKGLSSSKAANNPDGGLESLLGFLERKASGLDAKSNRAIRIKKVCSLLHLLDHELLGPSPYLSTRSQAKHTCNESRIDTPLIPAR